MKLPENMIPGRLLRRYKRFFADVELADGSMVTAHTPNTGSMQQCAVPGHEVLLSRSDNPKRKLAYTLELIRVDNRWVDTNTHRANRVVEEGLRTGTVSGLAGYSVQPEFRFGDSRIDFMLESKNDKVLLEVKNVTLIDDSGRACFPDAVTVRGQKHLRELMAGVEQGWRGIMFYLVQRSAETFAPADHIDPEYGKLLRRAVAAVVEVIAMRTVISPESVQLERVIDVEL